MIIIYNLLYSFICFCSGGPSLSYPVFHCTIYIAFTGSLFCRSLGYWSILLNITPNYGFNIGAMSGLCTSNFSSIYWCRGLDRHVRAHHLRRRHCSCRDSDRVPSGANRVCAHHRSRSRDNSCSSGGSRDFRPVCDYRQAAFRHFAGACCSSISVLSLSIVPHDWPVRANTCREHPPTPWPPAPAPGVSSRGRRRKSCWRDRAFSRWLPPPTTTTTSYAVRFAPPLAGGSPYPCHCRSWCRPRRRHLLQRPTARAGSRFSAWCDAAIRKPSSTAFRNRIEQQGTESARREAANTVAFNALFDRMDRL